MRVAAASLLSCLLFLGCRSKYVDATLTNSSGKVLNLVQVEYPHASFGTQRLAPGQSFHYQFKLLGTGPIKVTFTDAAQHEHQQTGPSLDEGVQGTLSIDFPAQDRAVFTPRVRP